MKSSPYYTVNPLVTFCPNHKRLDSQPGDYSLSSIDKIDFLQVYVPQYKWLFETSMMPELGWCDVKQPVKQDVPHASTGPNQVRRLTINIQGNKSHLHRIRDYQKVTVTILHNQTRAQCIYLLGSWSVAYTIITTIL